MQTQETQQNRAVRSVRISVFPCFLFLSAQMYTHAAIPVALVLSLMIIMTVILRNSCKVKPIQPMQKELSGKVRASEHWEKDVVLDCVAQ